MPAGVSLYYAGRPVVKDAKRSERPCDYGRAPVHWCIMRETPDRERSSLAGSLKELVSGAIATSPDSRRGNAALSPDEYREQGLRALLLGLFILGTVNITPYIVDAFGGVISAALILRAAMLLTVATLFLLKGMHGKALFIAFSAAAFVFSFAAFATTGPYGEGLIWLTAFPIACGLLLGSRFGVAALALAAMEALALLHARKTGLVSWAFADGPVLSLLLSALGLDLLVLTGISMYGKLFREVAESSRSLRERLEGGNQELEMARKELTLRNERYSLMEESLGKQRSLYRALLEHSKDIVMLLDVSGRIREASPATVSLLGYDPQDLAGGDFFQHMSPEDEPDQRTMFSSALVSGIPTFSSIFSMLRCDGTTLPVESHGSNYLYNPDIAGVLITLRDLTSQKNAEAKAEFFEHFDQLTGLPNRESFMLDTERAVTIARNRGRVFGVMAIGLDRFKRINDLYGTAAGDTVLREAAHALRGAFRNDDIVARYRGDKFLALFPDIKSQDHIKEIIAKGQSAFAKPVRLDLGDEVTLSASIGVALYPNDARSAEDLVRNAETALYMAKESGRDRYRLFDAQLNGFIIERQKIETDLNAAIAQERLVPFFQPKVDRNGCIVGAEALVRWRH